MISKQLCTSKKSGSACSDFRKLLLKVLTLSRKIDLISLSTGAHPRSAEYAIFIFDRSAPINS